MEAERQGHVQIQVKIEFLHPFTLWDYFHQGQKLHAFMSSFQKSKVCLGEMYSG